MSRLFQNTVTVYNRYTKNAGSWTGGLPPVPSIAYSHTVINKVMWKDNVHTNSSDGKSFINKTVSITIPLDEMKTDKTFVKPEVFPSIAETNVWSLQVGDIIVYGECDKDITPTYSISDLQKEYKTIKVEAVSDSTDQDVLPKWEINGV